MKLSLSALLLASSMFATAHAANISIVPSPITGTVYTGVPDWNDASDVNNMSVGTGKATGSATFVVTSGGIKYASPPSAYTVAGFLNHPGFSNKTGTFMNGDSADNIELVITGSLSLNAGDKLTITHDDGAVLYLNGVNVINSPLGTVAIDSSYTVTTAMAGLDTFKLYYAEGNGKPANLNFTVNGLTVGQTPEPSSLILLGTGIASAAGAARRRFTRKA